jgi:hypothetical protein
MLVAVSSLGTDLDAWTGIPFGACSQFLVADTETMEFVVVSVPTQQQDPTKVSLSAIRAIARQGAEVVITGPINTSLGKPRCTLANECCMWSAVTTRAPRAAPSSSSPLRWAVELSSPWLRSQHTRASPSRGYAWISSARQSRMTPPGTRALLYAWTLAAT